MPYAPSTAALLSFLKPIWKMAEILVVFWYCENTPSMLTYVPKGHTISGRRSIGADPKNRKLKGSFSIYIQKENCEYDKAINSQNFIFLWCTSSNNAPNTERSITSSKSIIRCSNTSFCGDISHLKNHSSENSV